MNQVEKHPVIAISGSIAAFRICELVRSLTKKSIPVRVMMTRNATRFIGPVTFEALTGKKVIVDEWEAGMLHIDVKNEASVFCVAPATANIIGKMAHGIADDAVSSAYLAMNAPVMIAPAMNPNMYTSPAVQRNLKQLKEDGVEIIDPTSGVVICGDEGRGRMADLPDIEAAILRLHQKGQTRPAVRPS
jgi:phosphopantothenoylcysteine decarboxylase/phosphopantothenoylcysteine decarboxylase/phosphopantothenate--cysteine ligase